VTGRAHDTLRDELAQGLKEAWDNVTGFTFNLRHWENVLTEPAARAALGRHADAQVAEARERILAELERKRIKFNQFGPGVRWEHIEAILTGEE
jgi:hypothetical protein